MVLGRLVRRDFYEANEQASTESDLCSRLRLWKNEICLCERDDSYCMSFDLAGVPERCTDRLGLKREGIE